MQDADFSDEFCTFIQRAVPTIEAVELLLIVLGQPEKWWTASELAATGRPGLSLTDIQAGRYLETLYGQGLLSKGADNRFRYAPDANAAEAHVRTLAQAYRERPVTLIRMIYALRDARIRSFADPFKVRGK